MSKLTYGQDTPGGVYIEPDALPTSKPDEAPTPRTDAVVDTPIMGTQMTPHKWDALVTHARQLERELAAAQSALRDSQAEAGQPVAWRWKRKNENGWNHVGSPLSEQILATYEITQESLYAARGRSGGSEQGR